jgi:hypothetical protein
MQRDRARLDVEAHAHLLRRADQHGDLAGAGGGEQAALLGVVAGVMDEADLLARDPGSRHHPRGIQRLVFVAGCPS